MSDLKYILAENSITVIRGYEQTYVSVKDRRFGPLRSALIKHQMGEEITETKLDQLLDMHYRPEVERLHRLSGRVSYDSVADVILFDNDPVNTELANYILELCKTEHPQLDAFVNFMERLANNPSEESRNELFNWFQSLTSRGEKMTLTNEGKILAYKGVLLDKDGDPASINSGPGIVDGVPQHGHLKNKVGSIVEVSRSYVDDNQNIGCSRGLHAGTFSYASDFAQGMLVRVEIDPADVVSVPRDCSFQKIRCCRYRVVEISQQAEVLPVVPAYGFSWSDDEREVWDLEDTRFSSESYEKRGFTFDQAWEIEQDGGLDDMDDWLTHDFTLPEILTYKNRKMSLSQALADRDSQDEYDEDRERLAYCSYCRKLFDEDDLIDGHCDNCGPDSDDDWPSCHYCGEQYRLGKGLTDGVCEDCADEEGDEEMRSCEGCGYKLEEVDLVDGYCEDCADEDDDEDRMIDNRSSRPSAASVADMAKRAKKAARSAK